MEEKIKNRNHKIKDIHKDCPVCGLSMNVIDYKTFYTNNKIYWGCNDKFCNHKEMELNKLDKYITPKYKKVTNYSNLEESPAEFSYEHLLD
jgi:C4-type Zn-finger protein